MGKTSLAMELIRASPESKIFIYDFMDEYDEVVDEYTTRYFYYLDKFCQEIWSQANRYSHTLVIFDEINRYGHDNDDIKFLYDLGRHKDVDIIAIARALLVDLPTYVRRGTQRYYIFQITEPSDLDHIRKYSSPEKVEQVRNLKQLEYIILDL